MYNTVSHTMLDQTLAPWLEHDSEFPELLVLESKLEWIFMDALDSVSDSESHSQQYNIAMGWKLGMFGFS